MAQSLEQRAHQEVVSGQILRCLAGDGEAWQELVVAHHRRVYYLCFNFTKSRSDAEDLTQDVFLKLFCSLGSFDTERGSFHHWLQNITRNHLVDHFRRNRLGRATDSLDVSLDGAEGGPTWAERLADSRPTQETFLAEMEVKARVHAALEKLSINSREAVMFCDLQELNYREAAEILRVPEGTVKSRLSRGRAELARLLSPLKVERGREKVLASREMWVGVGRVRAKRAGETREFLGGGLRVAQLA
jgi:RNA polymerase sigma-70 factor (ECF subfamily)